MAVDVGGYVEIGAATFRPAAAGAARTNRSGISSGARPSCVASPAASQTAHNPP